MKILSILILGVVAFTAILGFSVMMEPDHMAAGCFGLVPGSLCTMLTPIEHLAAHIRAFASVSSAVFVTISLVFALIMLFFVLPGSPGDSSRSDRGRYAGAADERQELRPHAFLRWLTLHEKRDPSLVYAF